MISVLEFNLQRTERSKVTRRGIILYRFQKPKDPLTTERSSYIHKSAKEGHPSPHDNTYHNKKRCCFFKGKKSQWKRFEKKTTIIVHYSLQKKQKNDTSDVKSIRVLEKCQEWLTDANDTHGKNEFVFLCAFLLREAGMLFHTTSLHSSGESEWRSARCTTCSCCLR